MRAPRRPRLPRLPQSTPADGLTRRNRHGPSRAALPALGVAAALTAALLGWQVGGGLAKPAAPPPALRAVSVGDADLEVSNAWTPSALDRTVLAGIDPARAKAYTFAPGAPAYAIVALGATDDPSLVPRELRDVVAAPLPRPVAVVLGTRPAWRYSRVRVPRKDQLAEITVVPTSDGVLAVACVVDPGWDGLCRPEDVERITLRRGRTLPPAADLAFRAKLRAEIRRVDRARETSTERLGGARSRAAQGRALQELAAAYEAAATRMEPLVADQRPPADVVAALREAAGAVRQAGRAAEDDDARRYSAAGPTVKSAEADLQAALARVTPLAVE